MKGGERTGFMPPQLVKAFHSMALEWRVRGPIFSMERKSDLQETLTRSWFLIS
jgi:hypothetical protein